MIERTVERMYEESEENQFLEVTYAGGDKEVLYFKDFNSGAMIQNIVDRAKKMAIKDFLDTDVKGLRIGHLMQACLDEFAENEDLPNTTNPDDWAKISGKKGERIVFIRTLDQLEEGQPPGPLDRHRQQHRAVPVATCRSEQSRAVRRPASVRVRARWTTRNSRRQPTQEQGQHDAGDHDERPRRGVAGRHPQHHPADQRGLPRRPARNDPRSRRRAAERPASRRRGRSLRRPGTARPCRARRAGCSPRHGWSDRGSRRRESPRRRRRTRGVPSRA